MRCERRKIMKIAIGCDHGGIVLKPAVIKALTELGAEVVDLGTYDESSVDYPVYGLKVAEAVASDEAKAQALLADIVGEETAVLLLPALKTVLADPKSKKTNV